MGLENLWWFQRRKEEKEEAQRLVLEELQGLRIVLRKQAALLEEVHRQQAALAARESQNPEPILDLCDAVFYLHRAFQSPGLMSRQHAQVLNMALAKVLRFAASLGFEMILEEGTPFDPRVHEAVLNRTPGSQSTEVLEVVQPGYVRNGKVLQAARVVVGQSGC